MTATGWENFEEPNIIVRITTPSDPLQNSDAYPCLRQGYSGPTAEALRHSDSPMTLFFFFMPVHIAACSNEYYRKTLSLRVGDAYARYKSKRRRKPELQRKTRRDIQHEMKPIMPHELCRFVGLLVARTIAPNREKMSNHWKAVDVGAVSRRCFGLVLSRDRFLEISRNLHFNPNSDPRASTDRAWKIRKIVEVLQPTFSRGYEPPSQLAFDEAVLPSRLSFNKMRVYLKEVGHEAFHALQCGHRVLHSLTNCDYDVVMVHMNRFEVYCGKKQHPSDAHKQDMKSGPLQPWETCLKCTVLKQENKCKQVIEKKKSRPKTIQRGSFKVSTSTHVPGMKAISWWGSRPAHFLCTGSSADVDVVLRQDGSIQVEVPCPRAVKDYHTFMGE
ncbi:Hypothetical protein PHPALM_126 [Phytophthora palmivora]|uniref:PiggyBac transposable element-derived protein domain-containing protein n=1 Tax=Phytophthora palmivora TaxID=4796 RepID=A0A2P4YVN0_9STRA|nr:Hypothetical protein PHPALM_126 [Phytophthora palmivora]